MTTAAPANGPAGATPAPEAPPAGATPDPAQGATPPAGTPTDPPAGTPPAPEAPAAGDLEARLKAANAEAADNRRKAKAAEDRLAALEAEKLTDAEKLQRDHDKLTAELAESRKAVRDSSVTAALTAAAVDAGLRPADAIAFLAAGLELGDDGAPVGVVAKVAELAKERPYLLVGMTPGQAGPGAVGGATGKATYTRAQLSDPKFYEAHRDDILAAAREGRITDA